MLLKKQIMCKSNKEYIPVLQLFGEYLLLIIVL